MKQLVVSVFDVASGAFSRPAFVAARGQAVRSFQDEVNRRADDNPLSMHPNDFSLYALGEWDDHTGRFTTLETPDLIARGADFVMRGE